MTKLTVRGPKEKIEKLRNQTNWFDIDDGEIEWVVDAELSSTPQDSVPKSGNVNSLTLKRRQSVLLKAQLQFEMTML